MNRFDLALATAGEETIPLSIVASNLLTVIQEAEMEGKDPSCDPSVMLIGMQVAFLCHSDFTTKVSYDKLLDLCRLNGQVKIIPDKEKH